MDITAAKEALRFFRIYDTKLYNDIVSMIETDESFLESIYFSYDYSRNSYYCPQRVLRGLEKLKQRQNLQELRCYPKVSLHSNLEALAFPHKYLQTLFQDEIIVAKADDSVIVIFKDSDPIFASGIFDDDSMEFHYFVDKKDRYAISQSLSISQIQTIDTIFDTDFSSRFIKSEKKEEKKLYIAEILRQFLQRFKRPLVQV